MRIQSSRRSYHSSTRDRSRYLLHHSAASNRPVNDLRAAARSSSVERAVVLLLRPLLRIDEVGPSGATALMIAAVHGHQLVAEAAAVLEGHSKAVNEMVRLVGVEGCGGASDGVDALVIAVQ